MSGWSSSSIMWINIPKEDGSPQVVRVDLIESITKTSLGGSDVQYTCITTESGREYYTPSPIDDVIRAIKKC